MAGEPRREPRVLPPHRSARHDPAMPETSLPGLNAARGVCVRFTNPDEFAAELRRRPPDVEPVVRLTYRWSPDPAGLPLRHLAVVAGYLRRVRDTLVLQELVHHAGEVWPGPGDGVSQRTQERADAAHDTVAHTVRELDLEVAAGQYTLGDAGQSV